MADKQTFSVEVDFVTKNAELFDKANKQAQQGAKDAKAIKNAYKEYHDELAKLNPELVKQLDLEKQQAATLAKTKEAAKNLSLEIREVRAQAKEIRASVALLKDSASDIDRVAKPLFAGGAFVVGGIFAAANKYVANAKVATRTTEEWKKAQDDLNRSGQVIGEVLATEALPILKQATQLTEKIAGFLSAHPEVVGATLKAGLLALTLGTLGKAVSGGIRLYADLKMDAALTLQFTAAELQLKAAQAQLQAAGIKSTAGGGAVAAGAAGTSLAAIAGAGALAGGAVAAVESKALGKPINLQNILLGPFFEDFANKIGLVKDKTAEATTELDKLNSAPAFLGGTEETQNALISAYSKYKSEDLALVNKHYADRQGIIDGALQQEQASNAQLAKRIGDIVSNAQKQIASTTADYNKAELQAEQDYQRSRAEVVTQGAEDIKQIEEDSQERLRKLTQSHNDKVADLASARDALGLARENKDFNRAKAEETANTNKEIQRRRKETAQRLAELDSQYAQEKQRRLADYNERIAEIKVQEAEQVAEASAQHAAEIDRIRKEEADKLKEEQKAYNAEKTSRYKNYVDQLNGLGVYLGADLQYRQQAYAQSLADLTAWLAQMRAQITNATTGTTIPAVLPTRDDGGYAPKGIYKVSWNNNTEWVMRGDTTKMAEKIVGGQLTQQNVLGAMQGGRGSIQLNYNPRFDGSYTEDIKRENRKDTMRIFNQVIAGMAT